MSRFNRWSKSISIDLDIYELLDEMDTDDIIDYLKSNNIECVETPKYNNTSQEENALRCYIHCVKKNNKGIILKEDLKKYICEQIDFNFNSISNL